MASSIAILLGLSACARSSGPLLAPLPEPPPTTVTAPVQPAPAPAAPAPAAPAPAATAQTTTSSAQQQQSGPLSAEQRKMLKELRQQIQELTTLVNQLAATMTGGGTNRERPAMLTCPWPMQRTDTAAVAVQPPPPGVVDPPRPRIPDCYPPGWTPPPQLTGYNAPRLPPDRPRPIVDDYLKYVITAPPPELVQRFNLDTAFYKKHADANGFPIIASAKVPDAALAIVRDQVNYMLGHRPDIRDTMIAHGARIGIMAETEYTTDVPEQRGWIVPKYLDPRLTPQERANYYQPGGLGTRSGAGYWNGRARGMGGTFTTCAEENVLGYYNTRYWGTNICVHEFAHSIMGSGIGYADPLWFQEIVDSYKTAKAACLVTTNGYGGNTFNEYWATGVEWYVGNGGRDRNALKTADPTLYELISRLIPENKFLPARANVAGRRREEMAKDIQERNPEWWQREQQRVAAAATGRAGGGGTGGRGGGAAAAPCTPAR
jgi:hypothetical protein